MSNWDMYPPEMREQAMELAREEMIKKRKAEEAYSRNWNKVLKGIFQEISKLGPIPKEAANAVFYYIEMIKWEDYLLGNPDDCRGYWLAKFVRRDTETGKLLPLKDWKGNPVYDEKKRIVYMPRSKFEIIPQNSEEELYLREIERFDKAIGTIRVNQRKAMNVLIAYKMDPLIEWLEGIAKGGSEGQQRLFAGLGEDRRQHEPEDGEEEDLEETEEEETEEKPQKPTKKKAKEEDKKAEKRKGFNPDIKVGSQTPKSGDKKVDASTPT